MGTQHEIRDSHPLLRADGSLYEEGWAKKPLLKYDRNLIKASPLRIKEWDYFYVLDNSQKFGMAFTIADLGYLGMITVAYFDFDRPMWVQFDRMKFFPLGKIGKGKQGLSPDPESGSIIYKDKKMYLEYGYELPQRKIKVDIPDFVIPSGERGLHGEIVLYQDTNADAMVIATSWKENRQAFYYNCKVNCMPVEGEIIVGGKRFTCSTKTSMGGLDWGRGVWTYKNRWYWSSLSAYVEGKPFGWNFGYGFSDRSSASENILFYEGKAHKLDIVEFEIDKDDYMKPWKIRDNEGRVRVDFTPVLDRHGSVNLLFIKSIQHQVFGYFTGEVILDGGKILKINSLLGFAEDVLNWW